MSFLRKRDNQGLNKKTKNKKKKNENKSFKLL